MCRLKWVNTTASLNTLGQQSARSRPSGTTESRAAVGGTSLNSIVLKRSNPTVTLETSYPSVLSDLAGFLRSSTNLEYTIHLM